MRVPTPAQEQARARSRQHDQLVQERKRLAAQGNSLLLSQGYGSWQNWWPPKAFSQLSQLVSPWILELLKGWVDLLQALDEKIQQAKVALAQRYQGPRPKGVGAASLAQLSTEVLDWNFYSNRRKIACLAGMVPSEWSTGDNQRLGAYQGGRTGHSTDYHRGGLADYPLSAPVPAGAKMAGSLERHQPGAEEKGHRGHRPPTDGRPVASANRPDQCPGTQPGHDRWLNPNPEIGLRN